MLDAQHLGGLLEGELDGGVDEIFVLEELGAVGGALTPAGGAEPTALGTLHPGAREAHVEQERLHPALVQRAQDRLEPPSTALAQALQRRRLPPALELGEQRLDGREDLVGAGPLDVHLDSPRQPLAQVAVELRFEVR